MRKITLKREFQFVAFNGAASLPANTTVIDKTIEWSSPQRIVNTKRLSADIESLIDIADKTSLNSEALPFREIGIFAFYNQDNVLQHSWTTSNSYETITADDIMTCLHNTHIFDAIDAGHIPTHFIDIHTHPSIEYRPNDEWHEALLMSEDDFLCYEYLSNLLSYYAGVDIPIYAIVRPVGNSCGDVVIQTHIKPTYNDEETRLEAEELKAQRMAHNKTLDMVM
jgi:hypothetical protein